MIARVTYFIGVWRGNCSTAMFNELKNLHIKAGRIIHKVKDYVRRHVNITRQGKSTFNRNKTQLRKVTFAKGTINNYNKDKKCTQKEMIDCCNDINLPFFSLLFLILIFRVEFVTL